MSEVLASPDELVVEIMATPDGRRDPYPRYRRLREAAPVHRSALGGVWFLTRYDDVATVLKDERFVKDVANALTPQQAANQPWFRTVFPTLRRHMLHRDPPDHTRLRALVHKVFTPRLIEHATVEHEIHPVQPAVHPFLVPGRSETPVAAVQPGVHVEQVLDLYRALARVHVRVILE